MNLARTFMILGGLLFLAGLLLHFAGRLPFRLGRLPGDIVIEGKRGAFYFPIVTCLLLSVVFSLLLALFRKR
jgi:hypothetical protein